MTVFGTVAPCRILHGTLVNGSRAKSRKSVCVGSGVGRGVRKLGTKTYHAHEAVRGGLPADIMQTATTKSGMPINDQSQLTPTVWWPSQVLNAAWRPPIGWIWWSAMPMDPIPLAPGEVVVSAEEVAR